MVSTYIINLIRYLYSWNYWKIFKQQRWYRQNENESFAEKIWYFSLSIRIGRVCSLIYYRISDEGEYERAPYEVWTNFSSRAHVLKTCWTFIKILFAEWICITNELTSTLWWGNLTVSSISYVCDIIFTVVLQLTICALCKFYRYSFLTNMYINTTTRVKVTLLI